MNQAKRAILRSVKLIKAVDFNHFPTNRSLYAQVIPSCTSTSNDLLHFPRRFYSSKSDPRISLVLSNDWSEQLEHDLSASDAMLTHEAVMYVLKRIDKDPQKASRFFRWVTEKKGFQPSSTIYSLMLRICAGGALMKEFWILIREMKENGFFIDKETFLTIQGSFRNAKMDRDVVALKHFYDRLVQENNLDKVIDNVVGVVLNSDWGEEVERKLGNIELSVSENFVLKVLKELRKCPPKALSFFKWVVDSLGFQHNSVTYNAILRVMSREESIKEFWLVLEEMKALAYDVDLDTYIKISRQFLKNKMLRDAVMLYEHMMDSPFKPSLSECSLLLRMIATSDLPELDLVFRLVKKFEEAGNILPKSIYDGIHRSLTKLGRFDEADKIIENMKSAGYEPDNITYSQLIFGLCKAKRLDEAFQVLDRMEEHGCSPDIKTWTVLIKGHCEANEVDKALLCFAKMIEKDLDADADLLDVLVNGFLGQGRTSGAYQFLVEMVNKANLRPWQATFKNLIEKLLIERKLEEALDLLQLMKKHNHPPYPEPFVEHISKFGTVEDAAEFLQVLSGNKYPSTQAYQYVFKAFFKEGRHSEANDLLYKCPHHIREHSAICSLFGSVKRTSIGMQK